MLSSYDLFLLRCFAIFAKEIAFLKIVYILFERLLHPYLSHSQTQPKELNLFNHKNFYRIFLRSSITLSVIILFPLGFRWTES
jgi:hypothetical protein